MGGDFAPDAILDGAILAQKELSETDTIVLIGVESIIRAFLRKKNIHESTFCVAHTNEFIEMGENPSKASLKNPIPQLA